MAGRDNEQADKVEKERKAKEIVLAPYEAALKEIRDNVKLLGDGTVNNDRRLLTLAARGLTSIRARLKGAFGLRVLRRTCADLYVEGIRGGLREAKGKIVIDEKDEAEEKKEKEKEEKARAIVAAGRPSAPAAGVAGTPTPPVILPVLYVPDHVHVSLPEVKVYMHLIITQFIADSGFKDEAASAVTALVVMLQAFNRRSLDLLSAKAYGLWSLVYERVGRLAEIREALHIAHRTAVIQHNEPAVAVLANNILRNYLHFNLYEQADKFRQNSTFPDAKSNTQHARYLYYIGRIAALQLRYSDAYAHLAAAIRKAPRRKAVGFRQRANKLLIIVQLLMGDIPDRATFRHRDLQCSLGPYFRLTQAVRVGDIEAFTHVLAECKPAFVKNVIKTGLRKINLSYSRISIADVTARLKIDTEEDAEYVVAKAIHDGAIEAVIDRPKRFVFCKQNADVYTTTQPQAALHKRIEFCNTIYNEAVKALSFPPGAHKVEALEIDVGDEDMDPEAKDKPPFIEHGGDH